MLDAHSIEICALILSTECFCLTRLMRDPVRRERRIGRDDFVYSPVERHDPIRACEPGIDGGLPRKMIAPGKGGLLRAECDHLVHLATVLLHDLRKFLEEM